VLSVLNPELIVYCCSSCCSSFCFYGWRGTLQRSRRVRRFKFDCDEIRQHWV